MKIPRREEVQQEIHAKRRRFANACRSTFNRMDKHADSLRSYGIELRIAAEHEGLTLAHGNFEIASVLVSGGFQFEILSNDYVSDDRTPFTQKRYDDPEQPVSEFEQNIPNLVQKFEARREEFEILGRL